MGPDLEPGHDVDRGGGVGRGERCQEQFFVSLATGFVAQEIVDDHEAALEQFRLIANDLRRDLRERKYERIFSRESLGDEHPILFSPHYS